MLRQDTPLASYTFQFLNGQSAPFKTLDADDDADFWGNVLPRWEAETGYKHLAGSVTCCSLPRKVPEPDCTEGAMLERALRQPVHQQVPGYTPSREEYDPDTILAAGTRSLSHSREAAKKIGDRLIHARDPSGAMKVVPPARIGTD